jgi:hypothetical protein
MFQAFGTFDPQRREHKSQRELLHLRIGDPVQAVRNLCETIQKRLAKASSGACIRGAADTLPVGIHDMAGIAFEIQARFPGIPGTK